MLVIDRDEKPASRKAKVFKTGNELEALLRNRIQAILPKEKIEPLRVEEEHKMKNINPEIKNSDPRTGYEYKEK